MRTGIYVYKATILTIQTSEPFDLTPFDPKSPISPIAAGSVKIEVQPGIYKAITRASLPSITPADGNTGNVVVVPIANNKDPWPDPPAQVLTTFNVTQSTLDDFFKIADGKTMAI